MDSKLDMMPYTITIDPLEHYRTVPFSRLWEATGLLPYFFAEAALEASNSLEDVKWVVGKCYGFPLHPMGGEVTDEGVYKYPEDPDLFPLVQFDLPQDIKILVYEYAITAFCDILTGETFVTRID